MVHLTYDICYDRWNRLIKERHFDVWLEYREAVCAAISNDNGSTWNAARTEWVTRSCD